MSKRKTRTIFTMIVFLISIIILPILSQAQEELPCVSCQEENESIQIEYGEYTCGCQISPETDVDTFNFFGEAGYSIRINLTRRTGGSFLPRLEIWDNESDELVNITGNVISEDLNLTKTGTYRIAVSDDNRANVGDYVLRLERIFPVSSRFPCIEYNLPEESVINPETDVDLFTFEGGAGTIVRINLTRRTGGSFLPRLEIWDNEGDELVNITGNVISEDLNLTKTGTYLIAVSDDNRANVGDYVLQTTCLLEPCPSCDTRTTTTSIPTTTTSEPGGGTTTTTSIEDSCTYGSCGTTSECTEAFGKRWACVNGCCENIGFVCPILALEYDEAQLGTIRRFRDEVLSKTSAGQEIIKLYYQWGPMVLWMMEEDVAFKQEVKDIVDKVLPMIGGEVE